LFEHDLLGKPVSTFPDHALSFCLSMIFSENRYPLFRIMRWCRRFEVPALDAASSQQELQIESGTKRLKMIHFPSWPGFVPAIHVLLAWTQPRRGCPAQGRA
jgi:hypothetical protein